MRIRAPLAILTFAVVSYATIETWRDLRDNQVEQIAKIAELESYAARSRLVKNVDTLLRALREVHIYWSTYGRLPRDQWADDASIELGHFEGIRLILWTEPAQSLRFARKARQTVYDYRPDDEEWGHYQYLLDKAKNFDTDRILGPFEAPDGRVEFEVYFVPKNGRVDGTLIAVIDTRKALDQMMSEDSPGFDITVKASDMVIYQRGEPEVDHPESWTRSGYIENSVGTVWEVIHSPTAELIDSMETPATDAVRFAGLAIAVLMSLLLIESGRANSRARAATRAQAELAELNQSLEEQVANRTRQLQERSRDLVTVTDSVSHDLRNPLNSISANIQLLEQQYAGALGRDGLNIVDKMTTGVVQMIEILDRLLSLSTLSQSEFYRERLDMKQLAEEIFEELSDVDHGPPVDFLAEHVPDAMGEPVLVQTLLMNLFSNALKYSRSKSDRKVIFSHKTDDGEIAYYVQDNGIGFDEEEAERMFLAFERLESDQQAEGLGLGLDIASRVVQRHGGRIWAEGKKDGGATFYFTLGEEGVVEA